MTVLDSELIRASGARDIPELLRLVPGMMVGYNAGNQPTVNYHGSNVNDARRMQVLIDGRSVYRAGLATVDWSDIPWPWRISSASRCSAAPTRSAMAPTR